MKRAAIQRLVPYEADYNRLSKYRKIGTWGLWTISACTVILPVLNYFSTNAVAQTIYNVINFLYFLIIIIYYHTAWSSSGLVCTASSEGFITGVKKGRLFERSEFLPFSRE